jgi:hypothetical protein
MAVFFSLYEKLRSPYNLIYCLSASATGSSIRLTSMQGILDLKVWYNLEGVPISDFNEAL